MAVFTGVGLALVGKHVRLAALEPQYYEAMRNIELDQVVPDRWRFRGATPSPDEYISSLWRDVLLHLAVLTRHSGELVGSVSAYGARRRSGTVNAAVVMTPRVHNTGLGIEAMAIFVEHLFAHWNFQKVYLEVLEGNLRRFARITEELASLEAVLHGHEVQEDSYQDLHILALFRGTWEAVASPFVREMTASRGVGTGNSAPQYGGPGPAVR